jgi:hypothetical protein
MIVGRTSVGLRSDGKYVGICGDEMVVVAGIVGRIDIALCGFVKVWYVGRVTIVLPRLHVPIQVVACIVSSMTVVPFALGCKLM